MKKIALISQNSLERIYELTYKLQMLTQEQNIGDYGLPQVLSDQAYMDTYKTGDQLEIMLDNTQDEMVEAYDIWIERHIPPDHVLIEEIHAAEADWVYSASNLQELEDHVGESELLKALSKLFAEEVEEFNQEKLDNWDTKVLKKDPPKDEYEERIEYLDQFASVINHIAQEQYDFIKDTWDPTEEPPAPKPVDEWEIEDFESVFFDENSEWYDSRNLDNVKETIELSDDFYEDQIEERREWYMEETALADVIPMKDELVDDWDNSDLSEKIILFQKALTTAHNNGDMAEYLVEGPSPVKFLTELSSGPKVEKWDWDLGKSLGYPPRSRKPKEDKYYVPASIYLMSAMRLMKV